MDMKLNTIFLGGYVPCMSFGMLAYKMLTDEKGNLYVKCRNCPETAIFMFDSGGNYLDKIVIGQYDSHEVNGMSFGEDGFLYVLAAE